MTECLVNGLCDRTDVYLRAGGFEWIGMIFG